MMEQGIKIWLEETVARLHSENTKITGLELASGERVTCDLVISNADPAHLYQNMLSATDVFRSAKIKAKFAKKSMGLFVLFFGTDTTYPDVEHHTIWLGPRYKALLNDIFNRKILADDFSLYLHRPTATDPSFAPDGCDSFYALVPVPNLQGDIDWETQGSLLRDRVITALQETMLPNLKSHLVHDFWMTPQDFAHDYLSPAGAGFSIAPSLLSPPGSGFTTRRKVLIIYIWSVLERIQAPDYLEWCLQPKCWTGLSSHSRNTPKSAMTYRQPSNGSCGVGLRG